MEGLLSTGPNPSSFYLLVWIGSQHPTLLILMIDFNIQRKDGHVIVIKAFLAGFCLPVLLLQAIRQLKSLPKTAGVPLIPGVLCFKIHREQTY